MGRNQGKCSVAVWQSVVMVWNGEDKGGRRAEKTRRAEGVRSEQWRVTSELKTDCRGRGLNLDNGRAWEKHEEEEEEEDVPICCGSDLLSMTNTYILIGRDPSLIQATQPIPLSH